MKRFLPFVLIIAVAVVTVGAGGMLYRAKRQSTSDAALAPVGEAEQRGAHIRGPLNAPVTLEEFGDFQCPPCGLVSGVIRETEHDYGSRLRLIFRHFPLAMHEHAMEAAFAAEAAGLQGRFWEMHDALYKSQAVWSQAADVAGLFETYARDIGLDVERFKKDLKANEVSTAVTSDTELGTSRGVKSTPTIFINGHMLATPISKESMHEAIEAALAPKQNS